MERNYARGEKLPQTKLKDKDVKDIRSLVAAGFKQADIAAHMGVSAGQVSKIVAGKARKG
jgi:predicted XRE-type DNA-binding protein